MKNKSLDVYIDSGINIIVPKELDPNKPEDYKIFSSLVTKKFVNELLANQVDFTWEEYEEDDDECR
jgi:hypothetical protein